MIGQVQHSLQIDYRKFGLCPDSPVFPFDLAQLCAMISHLKMQVLLVALHGDYEINVRYLILDPKEYFLRKHCRQRGRVLD